MAGRGGTASLGAPVATLPHTARTRCRLRASTPLPWQRWGSRRPTTPPGLCQLDAWQLAGERAVVLGAIERLPLISVMFGTGARPHPPRALYRAYLQQSDVFVGVYWERYGWVAPGEPVSGLEDEYRLAVGRLSQLIYIREPAPRPGGRDGGVPAADQGGRRLAYRRFGSHEELDRLVSDDLAVLLSERFRASGDQAAPAPTLAPRGPAPLGPAAPGRSAWPPTAPA
jgi:Domain of unknown function (DUF4062)